MLKLHTPICISSKTRKLKFLHPILVNMKELAAVKMLERKSRFMAHLYYLDDPEEEAVILKLHRSKYKKAAHHCYAIRCQSLEKSKDDGEVGHPGRVLAEILKKNKMDSHMLIVSRIFGGVKLGIGGVSRAFREVGQNVAESQQNHK